MSPIRSRLRFARLDSDRVRMDMLISCFVLGARVRFSLPARSLADHPFVRPSVRPSIRNCASFVQQQQTTTIDGGGGRTENSNGVLNDEDEEKRTTKTQLLVMSSQAVNKRPELPLLISVSSSLAWSFRSFGRPSIAQTIVVVVVDGGGDGRSVKPFAMQLSELSELNGHLLLCAESSVTRQVISPLEQ